MHTVKVRVERTRVSEVPISPLIFGNFIELGLGRQASGMWAELLYNRSFHAVAPASAHLWGWLGIDPAHYDARAPFWHSGYEETDWEPLPGTEMARTHGFEPHKGNDSLGLANRRDGTAAGILQRGIVLRRGERYRFALFGAFGPCYARKTTIPEELFDPARDPAPETREVVVTVRPEASGDEPVARRLFAVLATQREHGFEFSCDEFAGRAIVEIAFRWAGELRLSWCSLVPLANRGGWRSDVVELLRRLSPPVIRFPGGCFASFYDWRDGVGPRAFRPARVPYFWGRLEENDVGIDEFLELCAMVGAEPQVCVNMMSGSPHAAAELVQYCNGSDATPLGRLRREHGVARKRRVRFWEMENEAGRKWSALEYALHVVEFARRMREVDPDLTIMMEYYSWGIEWLPRMLEVAGPYVDVVIHRDSDRPFLAKAIAVLRDYNGRNGTSIRHANTEWLPEFDSPEPFAEEGVPRTYSWEPSGNDYRKTLSYRQVRWFYALNAASRILDYLSCGGELLLANYNNCVNTWGQNVIEASKEGAWLSPSGRVFEFFKGDDSAFPLLTESAPCDPSVVNLQACETADGGVNLYAVNRGTAEVALDLELPEALAPTRMRVLDAEHRLVTNALGEDRIRLREPAVQRRPVLAPISLTHLVFRRGP